MQSKYGDSSVVEKIVEEISTAEQVGPTDLPPIYEEINPDALNQLFRSDNGPLSDDIEVSFSYNGYSVTVTDDGAIEVEDFSE